MKNTDSRLRALEAHAAQNSTVGTVMSLTEWKTYCATGILPDRPAARQWHEEVAQVRMREAEATMALFEDFDIEQSGGSTNGN